MCWLIHNYLSVFYLLGVSYLVVNHWPFIDHEFQVPPTLRFVMEGEMPEYLLAKDLILQVSSLV